MGLDCDTLLDHLLGCSSLLPWERFGELGFCVFHSTSVLVSCHDVIVFMQEIPFLTTSCFSCWRWFYLCHCQCLNISRLTLKAHFSEIWSLFSLNMVSFRYQCTSPAPTFPQCPLAHPKAWAMCRGSIRAQRSSCGKCQNMYDTLKECMNPNQSMCPIPWTSPSAESNL